MEKLQQLNLFDVGSTFGEGKPNMLAKTDEYSKKLLLGSVGVLF